MKGQWQDQVARGRWVLLVEGHKRAIIRYEVSDEIVRNQSVALAKRLAHYYGSVPQPLQAVIDAEGGAG